MWTHFIWLLGCFEYANFHLVYFFDYFKFSFLVAQCVCNTRHNYRLQHLIYEWKKWIKRTQCKRNGVCSLVIFRMPFNISCFSVESGVWNNSNENVKKEFSLPHCTRITRHGKHQIRLSSLFSGNFLFVIFCFCDRQTVFCATRDPLWWKGWIWIVIKNCLNFMLFSLFFARWFLCLFVFLH